VVCPTIRTARLVLRQPILADAEPIARYLNNIEVAGNLAQVPYPYERSYAENWLRSLRAPSLAEAVNFSIDLDGSGYVGHIGYQSGPTGPVLGYWLGQPFWNQGIMSEAAAAAVAWFFAQTQAPALYSGVYHFNHASLAVQKRLGFTEMGRSPLHCLARDAEVEHIDTILTHSVWKARQA
jgi:RimJ/RimL family protein N-acetyltransferase